MRRNAACPPPGKGRDAEQGYERGGLIIAALESVRRETGAYPAALEELVPSYLEVLPLDPEGEPFGYHLTEQGYELDFQYVGPGINHCVYTPRAAEWWCEGAY